MWGIVMQRMTANQRELRAKCTFVTRTHVSTLADTSTSSQEAKQSAAVSQRKLCTKLPLWTAEPCTITYGSRGTPAPSASATECSAAHSYTRLLPPHSHEKGSVTGRTPYAPLRLATSLQKAGCFCKKRTRSLWPCLQLCVYH